MKYVSIQLKEYSIDPSFSMCTDCVLFSEDFLNLYAADAALIDTGATRTSVSMDIIGVGKLTIEPSTGNRHKGELLFPTP